MSHVRATVNVRLVVTGTDDWHSDELNNADLMNEAIGAVVREGLSELTDFFTGENASGRIDLFEVDVNHTLVNTEEAAA